MRVSLIGFSGDGLGAESIVNDIYYTNGALLIGCSIDLPRFEVALLALGIPSIGWLFCSGSFVLRLSNFSN